MAGHITAEALRALTSYDPDTGLFTLRLEVCKKPPGTVIGHPCNGYVRISLLGRGYLAHRLAWLYVHGTWPEKYLDHINGVRHDNRIANLRDVDGKTNTRNVHKAYGHNKSSGVLGVSWHKVSQRWHARLRVGDRRHFLGAFKTIEEGQAAYLAAKAKYHAEEKPRNSFDSDRATA